MISLPDIDIDTQSTIDLNIFDCVRASRVHQEKLLPHPSGYYFENIPIDSVTNLAAIPYKEANELEYFKVDFLHNTSYDKFESRAEIKRLLDIEPDWSLLECRDNIEKLPQIHNQAEIVMSVKPQSINDLADILALIRPGKRHLLVPYTRGLIDREELYTDSDKYRFRKSHSVAYAHVVMLHMHLL